MREKKDAPALPFYESHPPGWLPKVHNSGDLGYPGFHPPRPRQDEEVLTTANVKDGLQYKLPISVEYFSYNKMINEKFMNVPETMPMLEGIMNEIFMRRTERIPPIPPSTFKIPTRVTLNDAKRQAWFADLANPDVPLHKLGRSVPHGAKGHDLLDLLHSNNVAISRAVWFLRVFGANETAGLRNKPNYVPTQYSIDMAVLITTYIRKQIAEISLPSAPRLGLNIKQTFKGVLGDADSRERWMSRFSYCLQLLRTFYAEDLVDHRTFLIWLIHQMLTCNLAQAGFMIRLADEYLEDILATRALSRPLVEACLTKLSEIRTTCANDILKDTELLLKIILQRICFALPESFVSPKLWKSYCVLLEEVLLEDSIKSGCHNSRELKHLLLENFLDIKKRNEAMLFKGLTAECSVQLVTAVSCAKLLNSISSDTSMSSISYFDQDTKALDDFKVKLDVLLTWSVTPLQYGDHRPFAAVTLIRIWRNRAFDRASRRDTATPNEFLQDRLFDWLDSSDVAGEPSNIGNVALLFEKLVRHDIFYYSGYIQRLIARAEPGLSFADDIGSRHRLFLTWIPLYNASPSLINQRKVILYGARARETAEEAVEREIRGEIRAVLPNLFEGASQVTWASIFSLLDSCATLTKASRFEQVRTFRQWLVPHFKNCLKRGQIGYDVLFKTFLVSVELMAFTKCFDSLLDLSLCMLEHCNDADSMNGLIGIFCRFATIWTCMDVMSIIVNALDKAHYAWKSRGVPSRPLLTLLMKFDNGRYLNESSRERLIADIQAFTLALQPNVPSPVVVPDVLPEILLLAGDPDPNAASILANGLWMKYRTSGDWGLKVWDNAIASLRQVPSMTEDITARQAIALRYASFLWKVDQHLENGLDADILQWFYGPGKAEIADLNIDAWDVVMAVLLYLAVNGSLKTTTVLEGLVYSAWQMGCTSSVPEHYLAAANNLCYDLLLREDASGRTLPPMDLFDVQCIRTRRQAVFEQPHFPLLIANIPALIALETNSELPENLRLESTNLRCRLCQDPGFRQGAYRDLNVIRDAFENSHFLMDLNSQSDDLYKRVIAGLQMILYDSKDDANLYDWPEVQSLLSPWKIAATTIQMQLHVKQLGRALSQDSTAEIASTNLNRLSSILFHHTKTADEAYYVAEMARGADVRVASKFINNGLQCISEILCQEDLESANPNGLQRVGELLRVLVQVSEPLRDTPSLNPSIDPSVQEMFMRAILDKLKLLQNGSFDEEACPKWQDSLILARLILFVLSLKCSWTQGSKELLTELSIVVFHLLLRSASEDNLNLNLYPIMLDTFLVVIDEIPNDPKLTFDPYRYYPYISPDNIPSDIPPEYRKQIFTLLEEVPSQSVVTDLVNGHRDPSGNTIFDQPVTNKPWEWIENLGEPSSSDPIEEEREREEKMRDRIAHLVKNTGSISLEYFAARHTGDTVKVNMASEKYSKLENHIRGVEDGLSESVFARDWRETRLEWERELSPDVLARLKRDLDPAVLIADGADNAVIGTRNSPAASTVSRSSTSQQRASPTQNKQTNIGSLDTMDMDSISDSVSATKGHQTGKRKASEALNDDEIEIIEDVISVPRNTTSSTKKHKAGKAPPASKTKAKRR